MDAFLADALAELSAGGAPLRAVTVPAPAELALPEPPMLRWASPLAEADGRVWSFAGSGEVARVEGHGEARFDELRRGADELFASLAERRHPDVADAPSPRLFGGLAFRPEPARPEPWSAFRDASFTLPRLLHGRAGDRAFLRVFFRADERLDAAGLRALLAAAAPPEPRPPQSQRASLDPLSPDVWSSMVGDALARIRAHELTKVVPAALCKVAAAGSLDAAAALDGLAELYPDCVRFAFERGDAVFLGATPERLVQKRGLAVETDGLAGSAPRRRGDDARAAAGLLESDKDRREHRLVVDALEDALGPLCRELRVPGAPVVRTLRNVHHLWTPVAGTLARPLHVLDLVRLLHPTPAVCGTPREAAIRWIAAHEPAPRGWYAGAVGWLDAEGDGAFSVAIRSGLLARREAWLYAGAGIVEGSDPALEYAETRTKQAPMLAALGLAP